MTGTARRRIQITAPPLKEGKALKAGRESKGSPKKPYVQRIPPESPAARDEGPRLIPLDHVRRNEGAPLEELISLADTALARHPKKKPVHRRHL